MIWKFLAKIYEEVQEPELKLQITTYFMNFKKNGYYNSELIKMKRNMLALTLFGWVRDTHRTAQGVGKARLCTTTWWKETK